MYNMIETVHIDINKKILDYYILLNNKYSIYKLSNIKQINYINLVPLPSKLILSNVNVNNINNIDSCYYITNNPLYYILHANKSLPHSSCCPIPFSFPYIYENIICIIDSNVYYYELTVNENLINEFINHNISIGFGTTTTDLECNILGWTNNSIGYHMFDGSISRWGCIDIPCKKYECGDTVGAGIIYKMNNIYDFFFTLNGKRVSPYITVKYIDPVIPMIGLNSNMMVEINFSTKPFKYDFKTHITQYIISTKRDFVKRNLSDINYAV